MLTLIAALDRHDAIGKDGKLPWNIPADLKLFNWETSGGALIMGRKTLESLPQDFDFTKRGIYVVSRSGHRNGSPGVHPTAHSAYYAAQQAGYSRVYGAGGREIYDELKHSAHRLLLTRVNIAVQGADTFFPEIDFKNWILVHQMQLKSFDPKVDVYEYLRR